MRRALSLIEVLIAIFVISIGLLGLAALIPVGTYQAKQGEIADRSAAVGRAAMRDILVRGVLKHYRYTSESPPQLRSQWVQDPGIWFPRYVLIDPIYIARNGPSTFGGGLLPRVTLWRGPQVGWCLQPMGQEMADKIFTGQSQLVIDRGKNPTDRPTVVDNDQDYTWMVMVSPVTSAESYSYETSGGQYKLNIPLVPKRVRATVVVFYKRDFRPEGEAVLQVSSMTGGIGGGDLKVGVFDQATADRVFPWLKAGRWVMLRMVDPGTGPENSGQLCQWYRIVAVSGSGWDRNVTLAGPDFNVSLYNPVGTRLVVIGGAVGCYEKVVELED